MRKLEPYLYVEARCIHCGNVNRTKALQSEPKYSNFYKDSFKCGWCGKKQIKGA